MDYKTYVFISDEYDNAQTHEGIDAKDAVSMFYSLNFESPGGDESTTKEYGDWEVYYKSPNKHLIYLNTLQNIHAKIN